MAQQRTETMPLFNGAETPASRLVFMENESAFEPISFCNTHG